MKRYIKPCLKGLGPLRVITKMSSCPDDEFRYNGVCLPPVCWIAAVVFEENFFTGPRVNLVRNWLINDFEPSGLGAKLVMRLYRKYGQRAAKIVERNSVLKRGFRKVFDNALAKAETRYSAI